MNLKNEKTTIVYGITILMFILNVYFVFSLHLLKKDYDYILDKNYDLEVQIETLTHELDEQKRRADDAEDRVNELESILFDF
ncbi:hypothetical protein [Phascolarctobacterium sp.]|uniref:hypothetical protein n=1 Tax=Phascolarctobacterium sp. TaxID=2049039 RepID=UPI00386353CE